MDFSKRDTNPSTSGSSEMNVNNLSSRPMSHSSMTKKSMSNDWTHTKAYRIVQALLSLCVLIVIVGLLVFLAFNENTNASEGNYVQTTKLQAVFLNTGQVYFGNIKVVNDSYYVLTNIFYLQTSGSSSSTTSSSSTSSGSVSLVKLGCELHAPLDQMVINRSSVTFWENLSPTGQVAKAVATWEKENPDGQKCSDQSTAGTSGQSSPQGASSSSTTTSGSSTSSTK